MADRPLEYTQFTLDGELITSVDAVKIGGNFSTLTNLRYTDSGIKGVQGMTKVNTATINATYDDITNVFHFKKDDVPLDIEFESHVLTRAENATGEGAVYEIEYDITTDAPEVKAFTATALHTDDTGATEGYFSYAPGGSIAYANGYETKIWGGKHLRIGAFYHYNPNAPATLYDYTDQVTNTDRSGLELATVKLSLDGINITGTEAAFNFETDLAVSVADSSANANHGTNGVGAVAVTRTAYGTSALLPGSFGLYYALFGAGDYFTIPDIALNIAAFTIEAYIRITDLTTNNTIFYHQTDANNYFHFYVDTDGKLSASLFAVGVETFSGVVPFQTDIGGVINKVYHVAITKNTDDWYLHVNGRLLAYLDQNVSLANYTDAAMYVGENGAGGGDTFVGAMDCLRISSSARYTVYQFDPTAIFYADNVSTFLIGCTRPSSGFYFDVVTANTTDNGVTYVSYWNGTGWSSCSSIDDSGITSGVDLLGQSGQLTFDDTSAVAKTRFISDIQLFWYKVDMTELDITTTTISYVTSKTAWQNIVDLWDGEYRSIIKAYRFIITTGSLTDEGDMTLQLMEEDYDNNAQLATAVELNSMPKEQALAFGFTERMSGLFFVFNGNEVNRNVVFPTISYWNGTAWASVSISADTTASIDADDSSIYTSFNNVGYITWEDVDSVADAVTEFQYTYKGVKLYWYKLQFSDTLSSDVRLDYVAGLPSSDVGIANNFTVFGQERLWLCWENKTLCSAKNTADVYNGEDSVEFEFGDSKALTSGAEIYNLFESQLTSMIVFFKGNATHVIAGNTPEDWIQYTVSTVIGCVAPLTVQAVNAVSGDEGDVNRTAVIWQGANGIYKYDGTSIVEISRSISDIFDSTSDNFIETDRIHLSTSFYDINKGEYHWLYTVNGSSVHDKEAVYDIKRNKWYYIDRGDDNVLQVGASIEDQVGNTYTYAANYDTTNSYGRHLFRLENGTDFDGTDITHTFRLGDFTLHKESIYAQTTIRNLRLFTLANSTDTTITGTHYGDAATAGTDFTMSQLEAGYRVAEDDKDQKYGPYTFHSIKMVCATDDEVIGFEPYYLGVSYKIIRS